MRSLITGISGFAGGHLATALLARGDDITGLDRMRGPQLEKHGELIAFHQADIRDSAALATVFSEARPEIIFHLAALTHVAQAWTQRRETLDINVIGTAGVLEAAAEFDPKPTVVLASSGQVYGPASDDGAAFTEAHPTDPQSPYAVSKLCAELLAQQAWRGETLRTVVLRTFNYTGPWQTPTFVCSDFARQVAWAEAGLGPAEITVGNLAAQRDFSDVRDIVNGYILAAEHGEPSRIYNLSSGSAVPVQRVLDHLIAAASVDIDVRQDPDRVRKVDLSILRGDSSRAHEELGWQPRFTFDETLNAVLEFWREQAATETSTGA